MKRPTVFANMILILIIMSWSPVYGKISRGENNALRAFFDATDGQNWKTKEQWKGRPGTENRWYGITCNANNTTVLKIRLRDNRLSGTLPAELGDLTNLETLILSGNAITGVHPDVGRLTNLTYLDLSNNRLSGTIPSWIRKLKHLKKLNLNYNGLSGSLPQWLGELKDLEEIHLEGNRFQGPLPKSLAQLSRLKVLRIGHNRFSGEIPSEFTRLNSLKDDRSNLKWNALYATDDVLAQYLNQKQTGGDWQGTQTVAPVEMTAEATTRNSITLHWEPIPYLDDGGGYRILYATASGGPYQEAGTTDDKSVDQMEIQGLEESTSYYFVIETFTSPHGSNRSKVESNLSTEITGTTRGTTISGTVKNISGEPIPNVQIVASDNGGKAFTDAKGYYDLGVAPGWSGTVTAAKQGYDFTPPALEYVDVIEDRQGGDYVAEAYTKISGIVADAQGKPVTGVMITFVSQDGKETAYVKTDETGRYTYTVSYGWNGTTEPSLSGYRFAPEKQQYQNITSATPGQEYTAFLPPEIGGRVMVRGGKGVSDALLTFHSDNKEESPITLKSGEKGEYSQRLPENWSGTVTVAKPGYTFFPKKKRYRDMTRDMVRRTENYKAEINTKMFLSLSGHYMLPSNEGFSDIYGSGMMAPGVMAGYMVFRPIYIWGGYGFSSKTGVSPGLEETAKWKETFLSGGIGYWGNLSAFLGYKAEVGVMQVGYTEEAFQEEVTGSAIGFTVSGAGIFKITGRIYAEISFGYISASDTVETAVEDFTVQLGGIRGGIGIGIRF